MTLIELKEWLNTLPEEFNDYSVVNAELGIIDEEYSYRFDKPVTTLAISEESKEILILNDIQEENK